MPKTFDVELSAPRVVRSFISTLLLAAACSDGNLTTAVPTTDTSADLRYPIASVTVDPAVVTRNVGDSGAFTAIVKDTRGRVVTTAITWTVSNSAIVRLHSNGTAAAIAPGFVTVTAKAGTKTGISQVTVLDTVTAPVAVNNVVVAPSYASGNIGDSAVFTATVLDVNGNSLTGRAIVWSSSNPAAVTVNAAGMAHAVGLGSAQLIATVEGKTGIANTDVLPREVLPPVVASVQVTPGSTSRTVNDSAQLTATALDSAGATITGRTITWSSTNSAVAVVSATGMGKAVGAGSAQLVATIDGVNGASNITVVPPPPPAPAPVASVSIAPTSVSVMTAATTQLAATLRDSNGNVLTGRSISWSSSNGLVAAVSGSGMVTGVVAGSATITATSEGVSGNANAAVTLLPPPPPPTGWSNMPSAYSVLTDNPFNPTLVSLWELIWNPVGNGTITTNATAPMTGGSVFQVRYPAGFNAGSAPATQYFPLGGRRNVFVGMWWKANADWQGHDSYVNKLQFLFPTSGGDMYMTAYGPPGGPYALRVNLQFSGADTRSWLVPNVGSGSVTMGDWHKIEWLVEYDTGIVRWWMDGVLVGNYTDVVFPGSGFAEYKLSPTWGGMGGIAKQQTDYFWFDHVTISNR